MDFRVKKSGKGINVKHRHPGDGFLYRSWPCKPGQVAHRMGEPIKGRKLIQTFGS